MEPQIQFIFCLYCALYDRRTTWLHYQEGGLGSPLVFAVIFFVLFHLLNTFGEKFAKQGVTSAAFGMWLSTIILVPVGVFLTSKAMRDSQLFNKEFYFRFFKKLKSTFKFAKAKPES